MHFENSMKLYEIHKMGESLELCERLNILQKHEKAEFDQRLSAQHPNAD